MVTSGERPSEIMILSTSSDTVRGNIKVEYAFRFMIEETTDENGNKVWSYEEIVDEIVVPIYFKPKIPELLKEMYLSISDEMIEKIKLSRQEIPMKISLDQ